MAFNNWHIIWERRNCLEASPGWKRENLLPQFWQSCGFGTAWSWLSQTCLPLHHPFPLRTLERAPRCPHASIVIIIRCSYSWNLSKSICKIRQRQWCHFGMLYRRIKWFMNDFVLHFLALDWLIDWLTDLRKSILKLTFHDSRIGWH